jgi:glycosyltransferase involved in cell wall biosynthesis
MRVPVLHPITRLIVGGAQENTMFTAALLDKERFAAEIVSGPQTGSEGSLFEEVRRRGIPLTILPSLVRQVSPWNDFQALSRLTDFMRRRRFQIVHTHSSKAGILGRLAARRAGVPVIIHTVHGWSFHEHTSALTTLIYILLERLTAGSSSALITVAQRDIAKGLQHKIGRPGQYHLIRSAIPLDEFDPRQYDGTQVRTELGLPHSAPVLGNVGRFSSQKNPLDWVRVAGRVRRRLPECRFLLVGDGPLRAQVERALREEAIFDRTVLTGLRRDPARMLAAMDVFMMTSLWEGLPRVIPEALAMGRPVVAYRADGISESVQEDKTGFLTNPGNLDGMAEHCIRLLKDPNHRRELGLNGMAFARTEFDVNRMVTQIADLYSKLLENHLTRFGPPANFKS